PMSSIHTTPKNEWVIAMPNILGIDPKRLTRERLLFELKKRNINVINTAKRDELVKELELGLANETEMIQD
ncbi:6085_t:CDS:2, partial [Funneliformis caledonium]